MLVDLRRVCAVLVVAAVGLAATIVVSAGNVASASTVAAVPRTGIHKIQHVVIIMQENRSFDSYFGTYPGADGIPGEPWYGGGGQNSGQIPCIPDPHSTTLCPGSGSPGSRKPGDMPFHDQADVNYGGPHGWDAAIADIAGVHMNGFATTKESSPQCVSNPNQPACQQGPGQMDVMGYHDGSDIPNYWAYAKHFVLQDHMFEPVRSWSLPMHLDMVSGWSALCGATIATCANDPAQVTSTGSPSFPTGSTHFRWTDLTYLLHKYGVSWRYYVYKGTEPDCESDAALTCAPVTQGPRTPGIWNPLPWFGDVKGDGQLGNIESLSHFFSDAQGGNLPAVSWIDPSGPVSEHPPNLVSAGQTYVTGLINTIMQSPDWSSTAIFLSWDDWGGFYDHVPPPNIDQNGYGLRVPGLVISPYAKAGYIDNRNLSSDSYMRFIEDDFLGGHRLNPATDGRPDLRPDLRDKMATGLLQDFNFNQTFNQTTTRPRVLRLPTHPSTDLLH